MTTFKIKTSISGAVSPQHPLAETGMNGESATYAIVEVPDNTPLPEVIRLFSASAILRSPDIPIQFTELGAGNIIK